MSNFEDEHNTETNLSTDLMCFKAESCLGVAWSGHLYQELPELLIMSHKVFNMLFDIQFMSLVSSWPAPLQCVL